MSEPGGHELPTEPSPAVFGGRYAVGRELGRGGMGRVLLARDLKLDRDVALKVLSAGAHDRQQRLRFEQEARAAGALNHPNVLAVYDVGEHDGEPYMVCELLRGRPLRGPLAPQRVLELALQLASGLSAAHRGGVVHRDLKPDNLFLTESGHLKILDFGIARLQAAPGVRTDTGAVLGTPAYMSPEQIRGEPADARSDVFACGVVLHELLTGSRPFDRSDSLQTAYAIVHDAPVPLPASPLAQVVARCLEKDPAARYRDGAALLADLESVARGERTAMGRRRRRRVTAVAGAALLASLTVAFLAARRERPRPARARVAVADFANETDDKDLAGLSGMLITALEQSKRLSVLTRGTMYELLGRTGTIPDRIEEPLAREMARRASVDYLVLASIRRFGEVYAVDVKVLDPDRNEYLFAAKEQGRGKEEIPALIDRVSERLRLGFAEPVDEVHAGAIAVAKTTSASVEAYRHLFAGEDRLLRNDHTHATGEFRLAIALDPDFALAHLRLSQTLGSAPGFTSHVPVAEGDTALLRALQLADRLPESARCTALAELELYEYRGREALARVKACADRYPDDAFTIRSAAEVAFHTGDLDAAVRYFGKSGGAAAAWHLQRIWWMRGDFERMRADAAARAAGLHEPQFLVWAEMGAGDEAAAERTIAGMEKLHPEDPLPCTLRANLYLYGESPEKADALLLPPRRCWPVMPKALDLARGRFRKRLAEARAAHAAATASGDGTAAGWALVDEAVALLSRGGPADTADLFSRAARLVPEEEFVGTWMRLGGRGVAAAMARLRAAHAVPGGFRPRYDDWTAWVRAREQGDVAAEIAAAESLAHGAPTDWRSVLPRLGNLYLRAHQPQKAIAALRASLGIRHPNFYGDDWGEIGHVLHDLGAACEEAGDAAGAREAYTRLLRLWSDADPDIPDLIDARARLAALH